MHDVLSYLSAHRADVFTYAILVLPTLITGLTAYPKAAGLVGFLKVALNILSVVSHKDSPGTFKLPGTISKAPGEVDAPPDARGFVTLAVMVLIAICTLAFGAVAQANPGALPAAIAADPAAVQPGDPAPTEPKFGGCVKNGKLCFGPSVTITAAAINLTTRTVEGAFSPGVGYGVTANPGQWYSVGADLYFTVDPAAQKVSSALLFKLFNGYVRCGVSKGLLGDVAWRIPIGFGVNL